MVHAATLLAFASLFAWSAVPATAWLFQNVGSHSWMTDFNATDLHEFGNPIVGSRLDYSFPKSQSWQLVQVYDDNYKFISTRGSGSQSFPISARFGNVPAPGVKFTAQDAGAGNPLLPVQPIGEGPEIWGFVVNLANESLALTASKTENKSLTLEYYTPTNPLQHWLIYDDPRSSGISPLELRPATRAQVLGAVKEN